MSTNLRFVSWAAVSSLPQTKKVSLDDQLQTNREHVERHNGQLVAELVVPGESRSIVLFEEAARRIEAYACLKELIDTKAFDVLIYLDRSRLGRKASLSMAVVELCHEAGIATYETENPPTTIQANGATSHDEMLVGAIKSVGAEREIQKLVERNEMGMLGRIQAGKFPYRAPWGWLERFDEQGEVSHIIDPVAQRVLDIVYVKYVHEGLGTQLIAEELNRLAIPPPRGKTWHRSTIQYLLNRAWRFAGYTEINRKSKRGRPYLRAKATYPALFTEEQAEQILAEKQQRRASRRSVGTTHRFSQCVWCETCNQKMIAEFSTTRYKDRRYEREMYVCRSGNKHSCTHIQAARVQEAVAAAVDYLLNQEDLAAVLPTSEDRRADLKNEIATLERRLNEQKNSMLRADDAYVSGTMSKERYDRQLERIESIIADIQREIAVRHEAIAREAFEMQRLDRLQEIVDTGKLMLDLDDVPTANAWFRHHFRVWMKDCRVARVEYL